MNKDLHELFVFGSITQAKADAADSYFLCYWVSIVLKTADVELIREHFQPVSGKTVMFAEEVVR